MSQNLVAAETDVPLITAAALLITPATVTQFIDTSLTCPVIPLGIAASGFLRFRVIRTEGHRALSHDVNYSPAMLRQVAQLTELFGGAAWLRALFPVISQQPRSGGGYAPFVIGYDAARAVEALIMACEMADQIAQEAAARPVVAWPPFPPRWVRRVAAWLSGVRRQAVA